MRTKLTDSGRGNKNRWLYLYVMKCVLKQETKFSFQLANMFENLSSSEWLLYISEWTYNGQNISNIRVTTKVAVHSLLSDRALLQDRGAAIIHNLACKEVKTVVCISFFPIFYRSRITFLHHVCFGQLFVGVGACRVTWASRSSSVTFQSRAKFGTLCGFLFQKMFKMFRLRQMLPKGSLAKVFRCEFQICFFIFRKHFRF